MNGGETFELLDDDDLSIDGPTIALSFTSTEGSSVTHWQHSGGGGSP
ncbi:MAG: hypothetical protein HYY06_25565 [Deltaproteobacteria bacterium]|nr:hypothetical protein [Deltaproteobacteria bacterium]